MRNDDRKKSYVEMLRQQEDDDRGVPYTAIEEALDCQYMVENVIRQSPETIVHHPTTLDFLRQYWRDVSDVFQQRVKEALPVNPLTPMNMGQVRRRLAESKDAMEAALLEAFPDLAADVYCELGAMYGAFCFRIESKISMHAIIASNTPDGRIR